MNKQINRRQFLKGTLTVAAVSSAGLILSDSASAEGEVARNDGTKVKLSLNAYSFNRELRTGKMSLEDVIDYCAHLDFDGLDATGYYFPGYPKVPSDEYIYNLKRKAFIKGITINGTGVRNDFAVVDSPSRKRDVQIVKDWIEVAEKLGATVIRIFTGKKVPSGYTFDKTLEWMIGDIKECVQHGKEHGVIVGLQNHNDFAKTADETIKVVEAVNSQWFGVILDVGSLRQNDPYEEIEKLSPYAVSWQIKEKIWYGEKQVPIDLKKIKAIIDKSGYRGFLPIETLGEGDAKVKVKEFLAEVRKYFG
ncbi:MAG: TIM barrel protein [Planctomycetes bacterium]|nr:TIM barrel protein [Planctomycetota bacterium]